MKGTSTACARFAVRGYGGAPLLRPTPRSNLNSHLPVAGSSGRVITSKPSVSPNLSRRAFNSRSDAISSSPPAGWTSLSPIPVVLDGRALSRRTVDSDSLVDEGYIAPMDVDLFRCVDEAEEIVIAVERFHAGRMPEGASL